MTTFRCGQLVVPYSLQKTKNRFGINDDMKRMVREKEKINIRSVSRTTIKAGGWTWDKKDLRPLTSEKPRIIKPQIFKPDMLMD
jgi:hypothetical protein